MSDTLENHLVHERRNRPQAPLPVDLVSVQSQLAYGHAGNSAAVPVLRMLGVRVAEVPTTLLSNTPFYASLRGRVLPAEWLADLLRGLDERGVSVRASMLTSGYFGSLANGEAFADWIERHGKAGTAPRYVLDPVIGDTHTGSYVEPGLEAVFARRLLPLAGWSRPTPSNSSASLAARHCTRPTRWSRRACCWNAGRNGCWPTASSARTGTWSPCWSVAMRRGGCSHRAWTSTWPEPATCWSRCCWRSCCAANRRHGPPNARWPACMRRWSPRSPGIGKNWTCRRPRPRPSPGAGTFPGGRALSMDTPKREARPGPVIGPVGSAGAYGVWLRRFFEQRMGLHVLGHDPAEPGSDTPEQLLARADVLVFAAPIRHTPELIAQYVAASAGREHGRLWLDITSIKQAPVAAMLASQAEVVGLHPMTSPLKTPTLKGRVVVVCEARVDAWRPWLGELLEALQGEYVRTTPEHHDRVMALVQAMVHAVPYR